MKITDALLNADPRAAIDCRSCRFFNPCEDCRYHDECTNQGPDPSYSGCCDNINGGMFGCWCPKNYGCPEGKYTDDKLAELANAMEDK